MLREFLGHAEYFTIVATAMFLMLTVVWTRRTWLNFFIKLVFAFLTVWGLWFFFVCVNPAALSSFNLRRA